MAFFRAIYRRASAVPRRRALFATDVRTTAPSRLWVAVALRSQRAVFMPAVQRTAPMIDSYTERGLLGRRTQELKVLAGTVGPGELREVIEGMRGKEIWR